MAHRSGRHFLQIPGPSPVPERVLRAIDRATIDHRGPEFGRRGLKLLGDIKRVFQTTDPVIIFPASGTGAWEAALVNTLSPGDRVLMFETGQFATLWCGLAKRLGLDIDLVEGDWRHPASIPALAEKLAADKAHKIKAVCIVHNETSTGVVSDIPAARREIDKAGHPTLLLVDTISSLASVDYRHGEWGVDVTVAGSQKGLMLPPGLSFNAVGKKALAASKTATLARAYWDWEAMLESNKTGYFPYTPATNLLYGLEESLAMLFDEGLENVFARHKRHAEATRIAVRAWGLEILCVDPAAYSPVLTGVMVPPGHDADALRKVILDRFDMSLGTGLGKVKGKVFRIGHLGDLNDLTLVGTLAGVEMGLEAAGIPYKKGGVAAAMEFLAAPEGAARQETIPARARA